MNLRSKFAGAVTGSSASAHAWLNAARYVLGTRANPGPPIRRESGAPRLLLLCRTFPPAHDGGVYRLLSIATAASQAGWQVDVVAGPAPNPTPAGIELAGWVPDVVRVHRWQRPAALPISRISPSVDGGFLQVDCVARAALGVPTPSVILASGPPFSEFIAARVLGNKTRSPYVLDYRDEWTENPAQFIQRGLTDRYWERFALAGAAAIICNTAGMARQLPVAFGAALARKLHVVPNGWDPVDPASATVAAPADDLHRSIAFFGVLTEDLDHIEFDTFVRDLERLLAVRPDIANRVQFRFVGRKSRRYRQQMASNPIGRICVDVDHQPASVVAAEMRECLGLLIFNGRAAQRMIPGKAYGYIAARRPILIYGTGGDTGRMFEGVRGARTVRPGDPQDLGRAIDALTDGSLDRELADRGEALVESTSRAATSAKLLAILGSVVSTDAS